MPRGRVVPGLHSISACRTAFVRGEELLDREADLGEYLAGVVAAAAAGALLFGDAVVVGRDEQLGIALEADDRELSQRDVEPAHGVAGDKRLAEAVEDAGRYIMPVVVAADGAVGVHELKVQCDGVDGLDIGDGHAVVNAAAVAQVGGEGLDCALASAEHYALIEDGESRDEVAAWEGLARYLVEVGHVHGVVALVEGDGLDVHLRVKQLGALGPYAERIVYVGLRANGGIDPEVFDAVFVIRLTVL